MRSEYEVWQDELAGKKTPMFSVSTIFLALAALVAVVVWGLS